MTKLYIIKRIGQSVANWILNPDGTYDANGTSNELLISSIHSDINVAVERFSDIKENAILVEELSEYNNGKLNILRTDVIKAS